MHTKIRDHFGLIKDLSIISYIHLLQLQLITLPCYSKFMANKQECGNIDPTTGHFDLI